MKLLIVEDNPSVRRILKTVVGSLASEILECDNGEDSVLIYQNEEPDFVLMDINLGNTNGIEAARKITGYDKHAKVIMVTSYDEPDLRQAAADAGALGFVVKEDLTPLISILKNN